MMSEATMVNTYLYRYHNFPGSVFIVLSRHISLYWMYSQLRLYRVSEIIKSFRVEFWNVFSVPRGYHDLIIFDSFEDLHIAYVTFIGGGAHFLFLSLRPGV